MLRSLIIFKGEAKNAVVSLSPYARDSGIKHVYEYYVKLQNMCVSQFFATIFSSFAKEYFNVKPTKKIYRAIHADAMFSELLSL